MTKLPPFILRQERRRQLERLRADKREQDIAAEDRALEWSHEAYQRLLDDIMALDPATRMLPSGVH